MEHCLLFGGRGHLAQTKIIPALEKENIDYTIISRKQKSNLKFLYNKPNIISFMSIPTQHLESTLKPYKNDLDNINPKFIIEKPHGNSFDNFESICKFLENNSYNFVFNDHYLLKKNIINIENKKIDFKKIKTIKIVIHENQCINDNVGILLDMYQSHVLMTFVKILCLIYPTLYDYEILESISKTKFEIQESGKYNGYLGKQDTFVSLKLKFEDINLECDLSKNVDHITNNIYFFDDKKLLIEYLSLNDETYGTMINNLKYNNTNTFLTKNEIQYLWKHMEYNTKSFNDSCLDPY